MQSKSVKVLGTLSATTLVPLFDHNEFWYILTQDFRIKILGFNYISFKLYNFHIHFEKPFKSNEKIGTYMNEITIRTYVTQTCQNFPDEVQLSKGAHLSFPMAGNVLSGEQDSIPLGHYRYRPCPL